MTETDEAVSRHATDQDAAAAFHSQQLKIRARETSDRQARATTEQDAECDG